MDRSCATSVLGNGIGSALGCIPAIGGTLSATWTCTAPLGAAMRDLRNCLQANNKDFKGDLGKTPATLLYELLEASRQYNLAMFNDPVWTEFEPENVAQFENFVSRLLDAVDPASEQGEALSASENSMLLSMPMPDRVTEDNRFQLMNRIEGIATQTISLQALNPGRIESAANQLESAFRQIQDAGYRTGQELWEDAFDPNYYDVASSSAVNIGTTGKRTSAEVADFDALPVTLKYKLTNNENGSVQRGELAPGETFERINLAAGAWYRVEYLQPDTLLYSQMLFKTGDAGDSIEIPPARLYFQNEDDSDGDGLGSLPEGVIGTDPSLADTDGDGVSDAAELQSGSDPLDGIIQRTGLLAAVDTPGNRANHLDIDNELIYIADGDAGLSIFNAYEGMRPIVIGQRILPGSLSAEFVDAEGDRAAVIDLDGLTLFDVSDPANPTQITRVAGDFTSAVVVGENVYTAEDNMVTQMDANSGAVLDQQQYGMLDQIDDFAKVGQTIYFVSRDTGFGAETHAVGKFEAGGSLPMMPDAYLSLRNSENPPGEKLSLSAGENLVYIGGIRASDSQNPQTNGVEILRDEGNTFSLIGEPVANAVYEIAPNGSGRIVYTGGIIGSNEPTIGVLDSTDPTDTGQFLRSFETPERDANAVEMLHALAYVTEESSLYVYNIESPDSESEPPSISIEIPGTTDGVVEKDLPLLVEAFVDDDVQVRHTDLFLNGQLNDRKGRFPFVLEGTIDAATSDTVSVRARATDTGGNSAFSTTKTLTITDSIGPQIIASNPSDGSLLFRSDISDIELIANEPIEPASLTLDDITLTALGGDAAPGGGDDSEVSLAAVNTSSSLAFSVITENTLPVGTYRLTAAAESFTDLSGNANPEMTAIQFTIRESPGPNTIVWAKSVSGSWNNPANWDPPFVPGEDDQALINVPGNQIIVTIGESVRIGGLDSTELIRIDTGDFSDETVLNGEVVLSEGLEVQSETSIESEGIVTLLPESTLTAVDLRVEAGAVLNVEGEIEGNPNNANRVSFMEVLGELNLPNSKAIDNLRLIVNGGSLSAPELIDLVNVEWEIEAPVSIELPKLTSIGKTDQGGRSGLMLEDTSLSLPALQSFTGTETQTNLLEVGAGSDFDAPMLSEIDSLDISLFGDTSLTFPAVTKVTGVENGFDGPSLYDQSSLDLPNLVYAESYEIDVFGESTFAADSLTSMTMSRIKGSDSGQSELPGLIELKDTFLYC